MNDRKARFCRDLPPAETQNRYNSCPMLVLVTKELRFETLLQQFTAMVVDCWPFKLAPQHRTWDPGGVKFLKIDLSQYSQVKRHPRFCPFVRVMGVLCPSQPWYDLLVVCSPFFEDRSTFLTFLVRSSFQSFEVRSTS